MEGPALLEIGKIRHAGTNELHDYQMVRLSEQHLPEIVDVHRQVIGGLGDAELCYHFSPQMIARYIGTDSYSVGVYTCNGLVAFRTLYFPADFEDNPGQDIGLDSAQLPYVAYMPLANVHSDYRGNSLQKRMTTQSIAIARKSPRFKHLFSIVSPKNYPSMLDKFAVNMVIAALKIKFDCYWRYVFYQRAQNPLTIAEATAIDVPSSDFVKQQELLAAGYYGFGIRRTADKPMILFGKPI